MKKWLIFPNGRAIIKAIRWKKVGDEMEKTSLSASELWKQEEFRMKMKKMLAILAALSVLGTTGLTVGAEDTATTTEPATEAITTTETEAETTAAETTAETETETETTVETAATEENQVVKMEDASDEITLGGVSFTVKVSVASDSSVVLSVLKDGNVTNLNNICVESKVSGELQVSNYYSVSELSGLVIYAVDGKHTYTWVAGSTNMFSSCSNQEKGEDEGTSIKDTSTFQINGKTVKVVLYSIEKDKENVMRLSVYVDGKLTNLSGIVVNTAYQGIQGDGPFTDDAIYRYSVHQYFSVSGNVLTINPNSAYGKTASYTFDDASGQFITASGAQTTTTTTENTTTTTTTVDPAETEEALRKIFEEYVAEKQKEDISTGGIKSFYYDAAAKKAYGVYGWNGSMHDDALCIITKDGVTEQHLDGTPGEFNSIEFKESVCFTCNGSTFIAAIVDTHHAVAPLYVLNIYDVNGSEPIKTNLYKIYVGNTIKDHAGLLITDPNSSIALDDYFTVKSDSVITVNGVDYTYDTESSQFVKVGDSNSGKTDNGSASNAPATKNTSGTPKTGDTTTVPAVAVGLTLTVAGVVAFISKRKK